MKILSCLFSLTASLIVAFAADPLTDAFQRGLLAEESQRDLKAAAAAYDEVIRLADAQRELVATSLFRLAEAQRRLGRTNEALAGYRRLVREFSDQTNLTGLAVARLPERPPAGPGMVVLADRLARAQAELEASIQEHAELKLFLERVKQLPTPQEAAQAVELRQPVPEVAARRGDRNVAEQALARLSPDFGPDHPEVVRVKRIIAKIDEQLEREVAGILAADSARASSLERQIENHRVNVRVLEAKLAQERNDSGVTPAAAAGRSEAMQLLVEEIRLAEAQVAEIQRQMAVGKATQTELLQAQRDVLALKRQAASRGMDVVDLTIPVTPPPKAPEASARWVAVGGEVRSPGALKLPSDRSVDLFEAINERGGLTAIGNRDRIQVGRGTNVFWFKLRELMTNRFELQHEDKVQVMERVF